MEHDQLLELLGEYSDEELAEILEFVEQMGSVEEAHAALDLLEPATEAA